MATKLEFKGNDIDGAINNACKKLRVPREELDIEIISTGSSGIFGLCKKKAVIRVSRKGKSLAVETKQISSTPPKEQNQPLPTEAEQSTDKPAGEITAPPFEKKKKEKKTRPLAILPKATEVKDKIPKQEKKPREQIEPLTPEIIDQIKTDLDHLLKLMDFPSEISIEEENNKARIRISGDYVELLTANDGQALDSLQYLLRKIIGKKFPQKTMFAIDAGNFREHRKDELQELALKLAAEVKETERTRTIPPLNPSERRIVHVALQDDKTIRSRSVGEGLFKKILIYLPGRGRGRTVPVRKKKGKRTDN